MSDSQQPDPAGTAPGAGARGGASGTQSPKRRLKQARPGYESAEFELVGPAPDQGPPRRLSTRGKARKQALDIMYEADLRGVDAMEVLQNTDWGNASMERREFTHALVEGTCGHRSEIDHQISHTLAPGWTLLRLPRIDRNAVRIAVYEILHTDLPDNVAAAEAVALVQDLSTDESPAFVSGVLGKVIAGRRAAH